jgi:hypothetical protein
MNTQMNNNDNEQCWFQVNPTADPVPLPYDIANEPIRLKRFRIGEVEYYKRITTNELFNLEKEFVGWAYNNTEFKAVPIEYETDDEEEEDEKCENCNKCKQSINLYNGDDYSYDDECGFYMCSDCMSDDEEDEAYEEEISAPDGFVGDKKYLTDDEEEEDEAYDADLEEMRIRHAEEKRIEAVRLAKNDVIMKRLAENAAMKRLAECEAKYDELIKNLKPPSAEQIQEILKQSKNDIKNKKFANLFNS